MQPPRKGCIPLRPWHPALASLGLHPSPSTTTHPLKKKTLTKPSGCIDLASWALKAPDYKLVLRQAMPSVDARVGWQGRGITVPLRFRIQL